MSKKLSFRNNHAVSLTSGSALSKLVLLFTHVVKLVQALPVFDTRDASQHAAAAAAVAAATKKVEKMTPEEFYMNLVISAFLVLAGGVFAGLTLGLMGQDEVYLKVMASSGEPNEKVYARKVLRLIGHGKHWVLVTLLLCNVITNETLPIVLDRCLGGGWPAVVASTASIVVFGEIIPQSICVRYGLQVGALFAPFVLVLMYIMYPIAYPCALILDHILGEDHGTVYKKSGLKTLVTLHKTMGVERLNQDEVTIISAVLDLKEKAVSSIMTPMNRVYTMSADTILDERTVEEIFNAGFSRIPIHLPNEPMNFIGMLLVRVLISYDPEDALPVASFPLATLPETGLETSCLNILNYFQEGKSHMIVVSEYPGEPSGAIGVLTLEDVIEELIGEEIVDESDVYIDINKNIKRAQPGPLSKKNLTVYLHNLYQSNTSKRNSVDSTQGRDAFRIDRISSPLGDHDEQPQPKKGEGLHPALEERKVTSSPLLGATIDSAKMWKPKNLALNPLETNKTFVTIKRPNTDTINSVLPPPNRETPAGAKYGAIHISEEGALREAQRRTSMSNEEIAERTEQQLDPNHICHEDGKVSNGNEFHVGSRDVPYSDHMDIGQPEFQETRSYRTGGIIESVINVQGVHKTIIEHVSDDESNDIAIDDLEDQSRRSSATPSTSSKRKKPLKSRSDLFNMNNYSKDSLVSGGSNSNSAEDQGEDQPFLRKQANGKKKNRRGN
jgi:metal transporter CNNM